MPPRTTRTSRAAAASKEPPAESSASTARKRQVKQKTAENSGRGQGSSRRVYLSDVEAGFDTLVAQGDNTEKTASGKIDRLSALIGKFDATAERTTWDLRKMFKDGPETFLRKLEEFYPNIGTRATLLGTVISMLDVLGSKTLGVGAKSYDIIYNGMTGIAAERDEIRATNPTNQTADYLTWEELRGVTNRLGEAEFGSEAHFVMALVTLLPPRRSDYAMCKWTDTVPAESANANYLVVPEDPEQPCWFHISEYKTYKTFGTYRIKLSVDSDHAKFIEDAPLLNRIIRAWKTKQAELVRTRKKYRNPSGLVLPNAAGKTDDAKFQRIIKESIRSDTGKVIGIRQIRRIYATHLSLGRPLSTADKQKVAFMMGHGLEQSDTYRIIEEAERQYEVAQRERDATRDDLGRSDRQLDVLEEMLEELQTTIPQLQEDSAKYLRALRSILQVAHDVLNE